MDQLEHVEKEELLHQLFCFPEEKSFVPVRKGLALSCISFQKCKVVTRYVIEDSFMSSKESRCWMCLKFHSVNPYSCQTAPILDSKDCFKWVPQFALAPGSCSSLPENCDEMKWQGTLESTYIITLQMFWLLPWCPRCPFEYKKKHMYLRQNTLHDINALPLDGMFGILFWFLITDGVARGLVLFLCSEITPDRVLGTIWSARD